MYVYLSHRSKYKCLFEGKGLLWKMVFQTEHICYPLTLHFQRIGKISPIMSCHTSVIFSPFCVNGSYKYFQFYFLLSLGKYNDNCCFLIKTKLISVINLKKQNALDENESPRIRMTSRRPFAAGSKASIKFPTTC